MKTNYFAALALSVSALAVSAPAYAQIDEIVVTARKRVENLQAVPAAVSAFSGAQLKDAGVQNITDIQSLTPNLLIQANTSLSPGAIQIAIRGIGSEPGFDTGVGLYVDDVYLNRASGALLDVFDVERIEVLKGPQGNLYGRNTIGGAVKYISREPSEESRAGIELQTGSDNLAKVRVNISGQVGENVFAGLGLSGTKRDGYQTNAFDGREAGGKQTFAARGTLLWKPSDDVSFKLTGDLTTDDSDAYIPVRVASQLGTGDGLAAFEGLLSGADNFIPGSSYLSGPGQAYLAGQAGLDTALPTDIDIVNTEHTGNGGYNSYLVDTKSVALTANWDINENWSVKSISALRKVDNTQPIDFDGTDQIFINVAQTRDQKDFSQELQANYSSDKIKGVFGLYYLHGDRDGTNQTLQTPLLRLLTTQFKDTYQDDRQLRSYSAYANVDWDIRDDIQLSIGGRYTQDEKTVDQLANVTLTHHVAPLVDVAFDGDPTTPPTLAPFPINPAFSTAFQFAPFPPGLIPFFNPHFSGEDGRFLSQGLTETVETYTENKEGEDSWGQFSPSAKLSWQATNDVLAYVGFASGFKSGGFNFQSRSLIAKSYNPETVNTYSAGLKSKLLDGTVRFNAEAFFNDYTEKQLQTIVFEDNELVASTGNVGAVESKGFEIETTWQPTAAFQLNANIGYLDADITKFLETQDVGGTNVDVDVSDNFRLGFSPKWTGQARAQYTFDLAGSGDLTVGGSAAYRSKSFTGSPIDITNAFKSLQVADSHVMYNASMFYTSKEGNWRLGLEGRNLSDERILTNSFNVSNFITGGYTRGRTWNATLGYDF